MSKSDTAVQETGAESSPYDRVSERVAQAYSAARDKAGGAFQGIEASPIAALLGGIAVGAIAGALLPRIEKERELLGGIGERIGDAVRAAVEAGREAGGEALSEAGFSSDNLRAQVANIVEQAIKAAGAAGTAAATAARDAAR